MRERHNILLSSFPPSVSVSWEGRLAWAFMQIARCFNLNIPVLSSSLQTEVTVSQGDWRLCLPWGSSISTDKNLPAKMRRQSFCLDGAPLHRKTLIFLYFYVFGEVNVIYLISGQKAIFSPNPLWYPGAGVKICKCYHQVCSNQYVNNFFTINKSYSVSISLIPWSLFQCERLIYLFRFLSKKNSDF